MAVDLFGTTDSRCTCAVTHRMRLVLEGHTDEPCPVHQAGELAELEHQRLLDLLEDRRLASERAAERRLDADLQAAHADELAKAREQRLVDLDNVDYLAGQLVRLVDYRGFHGREGSTEAVALNDDAGLAAIIGAELAGRHEFDHDGDDAA